LITDVESAEMIKYASNSFLAMKISFINAISQICERCGANVADVAKGMGMDVRIGSQFLQAGLGWGGSCFPKDVQGLQKTAERLGYEFGLLDEVQRINDDQTLRFLNRIEQRLGGLEGKTIAVMGLAFKPNTDDIRDAKSLIILEQVLEKGANVRAFDPIATEHVRKLFPQVTYVDNVYQVTEGADVAILVTEWNEFKQLDLARLGAPMKQKILFDGRRIYTKSNLERAGFEYHTIGSR
jgi:UDPglucose 6-dehydrogenase